MALIRSTEENVPFKVVYCGPPCGGKTSNLRHIYRRLDSRWRGDMISVETENGSTISFDYLPINAAQVGGRDVKFQLFTVPGQRSYSGRRKAVLAGADAVVFVADSDPDRLAENRIALDETVQCLEENEIDPGSIPMVFQFNKRDVAGAVTPHELDDVLAVTGPSFLSSAVSGHQVFATLDRVTQLLLDEFSREEMLVHAIASRVPTQCSAKNTAVAS